MMETKTWYENSQINFGLILTGKKPMQAYSPRDFHPPYDKALEIIKGNDNWQKEDLYKAQIPPSELDSAQHAATALNGSSELDWASILRESAAIYEISEEMVKLGRSGQQGRLPELMPLITKMRSFAKGERTGLKDVRDVDWQSAVGLQRSGWKAIDIFGGMAESGLIDVCAPTKTGKSFFLGKFTDEFTNFYKDRRVATFPLELTDARYFKRVFEMYPRLVKVQEDGRLFTSSTSRTVSQIYTDVEGMGDCGLVIIDGLRQLVRGTMDTSKVAGIWTELQEMGVLLKVPIMITLQPNREGKWTSTNKFLDMYSAEWSGDAENNCEQFWVLQHVDHAVDFDDERFPVFDDAYYLISWLQREGWIEREDWPFPVQKGPGAVIFKDHVYDKGGNVRLWEGEPYQNQLFKPGAMRLKKKSTRIKE